MFKTHHGALYQILWLYYQQTRNDYEQSRQPSTCHPTKVDEQ